MLFYFELNKTDFPGYFYLQIKRFPFLTQMMNSFC